MRRRLTRFAVWVAVAAGVACGQQQPKLSDVAPQTDGRPEVLRLSQELIASGEFKKAENALRVYLLKNDLSAEAHEMLAYALLRQDKPKESLGEYTRAAQLQQPTATMLEHVGQDYVLLDDWTDAERWTTRAVQMDRKDADAWYSLGRIRYHDQRFADALSCFEEALKLAPRSVKAENNLGLTYEALNQTDNAVAAYRQAIAWQEAGPAGEQSEQPLLNLATVLVHRGELDGAEPLLKQAEQLAPKDARVHEQLGQLYLQRPNYAASAEELKRACDLDPNNSSLHYLLGQAYRHEGKRAEATAEFSRAAQLANPSAKP